MKPTFSNHETYRKFVHSKLHQYYPDLNALPKSVLTIYKKFKNLDLSKTESLMRDKYSVFGPNPYAPSSMLRSMLVAAALNISSITKWVATMRVTPIYAIISGFSPDKIPGVGTFYDFQSRLWDQESPNFSPYIKPVPIKVKKPKGKGSKADSVEKESVADLINRLKNTDFQLKDEAYATLFTIFKECFVSESIKRGVIHPDNLRIAGDGTPIVTSQRLRSHHTCTCISNGIFNCSCDRKYMQPDCDIGWDSSREKFYFGYDMYILTDADNDLPLFALMNSASRHDSRSFCEAFFRFRSFMPQTKISQLLLDSAHDNMATYNLCHDYSIVPFIDLNLGNTKKTSDYHGVTIGPDGIPICPKGLKMKSNGNDRVRQYAKFICPLTNGTSCSCDTPCSDTKYGRTCSIPLKNNVRLYNNPPRNSDEWKKMYNSRTSSERCNKRLKIDYNLESGKYHSSKSWYIHSYVLMMLLHLDAWTIVE